MAASPTLPPGFRAGHWTDREAATGCTVVLPPPGGVASCEVRGGGPGTRETDLLSPAANPPGVDALLLTGGSAFGLAAADGVVRWLAERGRGYETPAARVPLVAAAVVYDLFLGDPAVRPGPGAARAACEAAGAEVERGTAGAGTGCTVGKLLGPSGWTKGGVGLASLSLGAATVSALAVVNAFGDVTGAEGGVLAGPWEGGRYRRTVELVREGHTPQRTAREATTLVCVMTDARITKTDAWRVARAANGGLARAVDPSGTAVDGDVSFVLAAGEEEADPFALSAVAAEVTAQAIRDGVETATGLAGCPALRDRPTPG